MRDGDSGWRRAGFDGPQCQRFDQDPGPHGATGPRALGGPVDGWRDAGYATAACEQFTRA